MWLFSPLPHVQDVFTPAMFGDLMTLMEKEGWTGLDQVRDIWEKDFQHRHIVSSFLQDKALGKKRLVSMPDRLTNTIVCVRGCTVALMRLSILVTSANTI